jgi:Hypothetical protein (DUF2513)
MKRDMDLVRKILIALEDGESGYAGEMHVEGYTDVQVGFHATLMIDGGLITGTPIEVQGDPYPISWPAHLTWKGYEFLADAKDEKRWTEAKGLLDKVGGAAFTVWANVLSAIISKNLHII